MNVIVDSKLLRCPHCKNPFLANWISSNLDYIDRETALMFAEKKNIRIFIAIHLKEKKFIYILLLLDINGIKIIFHQIIW